MRFPHLLTFVLPAALIVAAPLDPSFLVSSSNTDSILRYDTATGVFLGTFVAAGGGGLDYPGLMTYGPDGNLYVSSVFSNQILKYHGATGGFLGVFVDETPGGPVNPGGVAFGPDGNLYVAGFNAPKLYRYDGITSASLGTVVDGPVTDVEFAAGGIAYVSIGGFPGQVRKYDSTTWTLLQTFDPPSRGPLDLELGPDGLLYGAEWHFGGQVERWNTSSGAIGTFTVAGTNGLDGPHALAFLPDGSLLVASERNDQVLRYDPDAKAFLEALVSAGSGGLNGPTGIVPFPSQVVVPEPATFALAAGALIALVLSRRSLPQRR